MRQPPLKITVHDRVWGWIFSASTVHITSSDLLEIKTREFSCSWFSYWQCCPGVGGGEGVGEEAGGKNSKAVGMGSLSKVGKKNEKQGDVKEIGESFFFKL